MGFEPTTFCLGSKHSTTELRPLDTDMRGDFSTGLGRESMAEGPGPAGSRLVVMFASARSRDVGKGVQAGGRRAQS